MIRVPPPPFTGQTPARGPQPSDATLLGAVLDLSTNVRDLSLRVANLEAAAKSDFLKQIVAIVGAIVTTLAGSRLVTPTPPPTQTVVQQSAFDRALGACKDLRTPEERTGCAARVLSEAVNGTRP